MAAVKQIESKKCPACGLYYPVWYKECPSAVSHPSTEQIVAENKTSEENQKDDKPKVE